jgi:hypothetical protein
VRLCGTEHEKRTAKTTIPDNSYDGLTIPLRSFVDGKGNPFAA